MGNLIFSALVVLAMGLVTSMSLLGGFHILIILPCLYFIPKMNYKNYSLSSWALLAFTVAVILSVLLNQDVALAGFKPIGKTKYFFIGFLAIAPFYYYFKNHFDPKKISILLYTLCIATTFATVAGIVGMKIGFNYISWKEVAFDRNAGLSGMILNYAHNLAFFQIIIMGLILYKKEGVSTFINPKFLYVIFILNFYGLYLTYTRGALLALFIGAPFYFFKKNTGKFLAAGAALIVLAVSLFLISGSNAYRPGSDRLRLSQWKASWAAFKERPVLGYGYLNFEQHSREIKERHGIEEPGFGGHAHNNFLEVMATTGIIGLLCYLLWLGSWLWEMYRRDDLVAKISLPFIIVFIVGGLTQATISLGVNLFFIMAVYSLGQIGIKKELLNDNPGSQRLASRVGDL